MSAPTGDVCYIIIEPTGAVKEHQTAETLKKEAQRKPFRFLCASAKCLRDSRGSGCTFGVGKPTLQSIVLTQSFCLRVSAFPFGAANGLS